MSILYNGGHTLKIYLIELFDEPSLKSLATLLMNTIYVSCILYFAWNGLSHSIPNWIFLSRNEYGQIQLSL